MLLEEKAAAGDWGVVAGIVPARQSPRRPARGTSRGVSAGATDEVLFTVQPFELPRFHIDTQADKPFYLRGDAPAIHGAVAYSSGAHRSPVPEVDITWNVSGAWPPPTGWALPGGHAT